MDFYQKKYIIKRKPPNMKTITFQSPGDNILRDIRNEVAEYFKKNNLKKTGNTSLYVKSIFMAALLIVPFTLTWSVPMTLLIVCFLSVLSGLGKAGVGMNIMHDASHGTYSDKKWVNKLVSKLMFLISVHNLNWEQQHNVVHHSHTNIDGHDTDIESGGLFRFTKEQKWKPGHRFQFLYAVFLYSATTFMRATYWDFTRLARYFRDHPEIPSEEKRKEWIELIGLRAVYFFFWIGVPILFGVNEWYFAIVFFLGMHLVSGLVLTVIFQTAHVVPLASTYSAEEEKKSWAHHQLLTTCNFATDSGLTSWLLGGLNFQKEHHLLPDVSHVHYREISWIVRKWCHKNDITYLEYPGTWDAVMAHFQLLYNLGKKPI